jgi:starch-binding outer membrane protein, SusD/RagB family
MKAYQTSKAINKKRQHSIVCFKNSIIVLLIFILLSCKKFVEVDAPHTQIVSATVFTNDATATSAVSGIYSSMIMTNGGFASGGNGSVTLLNGLAADEFINYSSTSDIASFFDNSLLPTNTVLTNSIWKQAYQFIFYANSVIEGLQEAHQISESVKKQLTGEAKFIRAFCHFYLVNLFGNVPMVTSTDYRINALVSRTAADEVFQQIITDLKEAETLLSISYLDKNNVPSAERTRPNKWTAASLLARVYLYHRDWQEAEQQATAVINTTTQYALDSNLSAVFLSSSKEAIWQLAPVASGINTNEGNIFILTGPANLVSLRPELVNEFEPADKRKTWINTSMVGGTTYYYPFKYTIKTGTVVTEYSIVLRLAEQYLIRAEARCQLNNLDDALTDLNTIRARAGLDALGGLSKEQVLLAIEKERRLELFAEWGHRWLDLKRTLRANDVLSSIKGSSWQSTDVLFPIPQYELNNNPKLTQNPGY